MYLRRAINHLKDAQQDLTNAKCLGKEIHYEDCNDVDLQLGGIIDRLERYDRRNISKNFSEDLSDSFKENLK